MLLQARKIEGYTLNAADGPLGKVADFYFDDLDWTVRYMVVDTGEWLAGRKVLLSPHAFASIDPKEHVLGVNLTRDQVRKSPDIDTARPVERSQEIDYLNYYGWPYYWEGPYLWGAMPFPVLRPEAGSLGEEMQKRDTENVDPHLHSANELSGYGLHALDGDLGHMSDFLLEPFSFRIRYLVIDTRNWWPGKKVLLPPRTIRQVRFDDLRVDVETTREQLRQAPAYDPQDVMQEGDLRRFEEYFEGRVA